MKRVYYVTLSEKELNKKKMYNKNVYLFDSLREIEEDFDTIHDIAEVEAISKVKIVDNVKYEKELKAKNIIFIEQLDDSYDKLDVDEYKYFLAKFSTSQEIQEKILQIALNDDDLDLMLDLTLNNLISNKVLETLFEETFYTHHRVLFTYWGFATTLMTNVQHSKKLFEKFFNHEELKSYSILSHYFTKDNLIDMIKHYNKIDEDCYYLTYYDFIDAFCDLDETILTNDILLEIIENKEETFFNEEMKKYARDILKDRIA